MEASFHIALICVVELTKVRRFGEEVTTQVTSALTTLCLLLSLIPQMHGTTHTRLLQSQGFMALQPIGQRQEYGVHVLLLSWVLGWSLKQGEVIAVSQALGEWHGHLQTVSQVTLVAHHDAWHRGADRMPAALVDPFWDALEGWEAGHVVHKDDSMDAAVVVLHHALPEALLTCRVPYLQLTQDETYNDGNIAWCISWSITNKKA